MTSKSLDKLLDNAKVISIEPKIGDKMDPNKHQAISTEPSEEHERNCVVNILKTGYLMEDRVINPAIVVTSSGKPATVADEINHATEKESKSQKDSSEI